MIFCLKILCARYTGSAPRSLTEIVSAGSRKSRCVRRNSPWVEACSSLGPLPIYMAHWIIRQKTMLFLMTSLVLCVFAWIHGKTRLNVSVTFAAHFWNSGPIFGSADPFLELQVVWRLHFWNSTPKNGTFQKWNKWPQFAQLKPWRRRSTPATVYITCWGG